MSGTKIINVVKDDSFEEIFDLFKSTPSDEVVFILPKRSKAFNSEEQFQQVRSAADELGKKVALLSANPETVDLARQYHFEILQDKASTPRKVRKPVKLAGAAAAAVAKKFDEESDNDLIPDDRDAFTPESTTDETMGIVESEEAGDGKEIEEEQALADDVAGEEGKITTDEVDTGEEVKPKPAVEDDGIDESEYQNQHEEFAPEEGEAARIPVRRQQSPMRTTLVSAHQGRTAANIKKGSMSGKDLDRIAEVWQQEPFDRRETVWGDQQPRRSETPAPVKRLLQQRDQQFSPGPRLSATPMKSSKKRRFVLMAMVLLLGAGGAVYVKAGTAKVLITPFAKKLDFELTANASDQFASVDSTFNKLPGQLFTVEKSVTQEFAATGQREVAQKAKGKITVYNTYGTTAQTLIATTRLTSSNGMVFRTLRTVTVPGTTVTNGSITPGSVEVEVIADKAGQSYNVPAGKFTIPAFSEKGDTARFEKFYGQSTAAMTGGISGLSKVVTEEDFNKGKEEVLQKLKDEVKEALAQEASGLKIPNLSDVTVVETISSAQPDEAADTFTVSMKGSLQTMGFKESDMQTLIKEYTAKNYGLTVLPDRLKINYTDVRLDSTKGILELTATITGNGYGQVQQDQITLDLMGKGEADIVGYLKQAEGVAEAKVLLSPFWVKKVPKNKDKVQIELDYQ